MRLNARQLSIPNRLFFDEEGLFKLFERYKFTVEENTPIEREVALDPELLGNVFENLLAEMNPETSETARKMTGSYYTPRAVVNYMTKEALAASLAQKVQPDPQNAGGLERKPGRPPRRRGGVGRRGSAVFRPDEKRRLAEGIADLKILDPRRRLRRLPDGGAPETDDGAAPHRPDQRILAGCSAGTRRR